MARNSDDDPPRNRPERRDRPARPRPAPPAGDRERPRPPGGEADRIAKVIARAGLCSRREAEDWIVAGRVAVNGAVIASPALNVTARDRISVDDEPLPQRERTRLFLYNKPRGLVTSNADPEGRPTIFDRLPKHLPRLLTVGRLDIGTEGLLLLTNDGGLARVLELPDTGWLRRYRVRALGRVTQADLDTLRDGVTVEGVHYGPIEATLDREQGSNVWLTFAIREGKNREVRNVLGHLDLQVNRLIRVSYGPFQVGELAEGEVEEIRTRVLREQLGERVAEQANADFSGPIIDRPREDERRLAPPPQRDARHRQDSRGPDPRRTERDRGERPRRSDGERPRTARTRDEPRAPYRDRDERPDRPARSRDGAPRDARPRDERPRDGGRRDGRRKAEAVPEKPGRPRRGHAWRQEDAPLRRHYRGERKDEHQPDRKSPDKRAGLLVDRKGRKVLVERFGEKKPPPDKPRGRPMKKGARPYRPDRASGPRPSRPKPR